MADDQLNLDIDPAAGIEKTAEILGEVGAGAEALDLSALVDLQGNHFDPTIHKTDANGNPILGSRNRLLLKKEAKKSAFQRAKDKLSELWTGEKKPKDETFQNENIPLSDHELPPENNEKHPDFTQNSGESSANNISANAKMSAEMVFVGYAAILGSAVYDHRAQFYPRVCQIMYEEELRTGRAMPIPEWLIMPLAVFQVGAEICQKDKRCKAAAVEKFTAVKSAIVKHQAKKSIMGFFKREEQGEES